MGNDNASVPRGTDCSHERNHAWNRSQSAIKSELTHERRLLDVACGHLSAGDEKAYRYWKVETCPALSNSRGSQIDSYASEWPGETARQKSRPHAVARFTHRSVGQSDDSEPRKSVRYVNLHGDGSAVDTLKCRRRDASKHGERLPSPGWHPGLIGRRALGADDGSDHASLAVGGAGQLEAPSARYRSGVSPVLWSASVGFRDEVPRSGCLRAI